MDKTLLHTECRFARHTYKKDNADDTHLVVLKHTYDDDTTSKELKLVSDYKRPLWVTKPIYRKHKQKKEYEVIKKLNKIMVTQSEMNAKACISVGKQPNQFNMRNIKDSPYLYGMDVPAMSFIKEHYDVRVGDYFTPYHIVNLDIESDVTGKYNDISIITLSTPGTRRTYAMRRLYSKFNMTDKQIIDKIKKMSEDNLPDSEAKRMCKTYEVTLYDSDLELMKAVFKELHKTQPDICTFHNIIYDLTKIMERLVFHKFAPEDMFCDPSIPPELRFVKLKPARPYKVKKGRRQGIPIEEQWTSIDFLASFMIMDTMTTYAAIRQGGGKLIGGYNLQNILTKNGCHGKINLGDSDETKHMTAKEVHAYMSENRPFEYTVYAEQDTVDMTNLELTTQDFSFNVPIFAGIGDFNRFNSSVHKNVCTGYQDHIAKGLVIGTTPVNPTDWSILGTKHWIKTLPSENLQEIGLFITNVPGLRTNVTAHADDVDCVSSYPSDTEACNISLSTGVAEVVNVGPIPEMTFRDKNINLISSNANNTEYMTDVVKAPSLIEMIKIVNKLVA